MTAPLASAEMLIRRPVAEVFDAFANPGTITRFWLESTSGPLRPGASLTWRFLVPGATETVLVSAFDQHRRIAFDWSGGINVDMRFLEMDDGATRVTVHTSGFAGPRAGADAVNATEGFSIVLCELKLWLETGRSGNLVKDKAELITRANIKR
jgi:uncharacterized protein YndB with AHSA1/START domain